MSPCAYVSGLLHPLVIRELDMVGHGYHFTPAVNGLFVPFEDGSSVQLPDADETRCEAEIRRIAPRDVAGYRAMQAVFERCNAVVRADADDGLWVGEPPTREQIACAATPRRWGCCSAGRWPSWSSAISPTSGFRAPTWARV
jgi:hypothetical protein